MGLVDTGKELKITSSASATTVAAVNAAGGLAGLVRGTLNVNTAYTDCYLNSRRTGGLVGAAPVGRIYATGFYTAGYQVATAQAAGILPGALKEGSFHYGYTAVSYTVPAGGSIYTTAGNGSVKKVYTTTKNALGESRPAVLYDIPGTGSVTSKELSSAEFANSLSNAFRFQVGGDTTPYNLLDQGLTTYPYPMLKNIPHYGDWEENAEGWNFVYFEEYADGTYGVYGSGLKLSTDKPIVGDGYGLLLAEDPTGQWEYQIRYTDKNGTEKTLIYTKTDHASNLKTITSESGITYYLLPMTTWTDSSYGKLVQDSIGRAENSFYCKAELRYWPANNYGLDQSFRTYWFNPYFAKTVIRSEQMPANPGTVSIRDARHLYSLSDYYSAEKNTVNAGRDDLPGLLTNTADKTYTFLQERTVDFDAAYKWGTYYDGKKQPTAFAPIGSDAYPFNAAFNGPHGLAGTGAAGEPGQTNHDDDGGNDGHDDLPRDDQLAVKQPQGLEGDDAGIVLGAGGPDELGGVLQEIADANGRDQHRQAGGSPQRLIGQSLDEHAQHGTYRHSRQDGDHHRQPQVIGDAEGNVSAHHDDVAVGEVQHFGNAINHGVAQGDDGIDAAQADPVDQEIEKCHRSLTPYIFYLYLLSQIISVRNRKGSDPVQSLSVAHCTTRNRPGPPEGCPSLNS